MNSILVLDENAKVVGTYDKIDLVPFGEFVPYQETLGRIGIQKLTHGRGSFTFGPQPRPILSIPAYRRLWASSAMRRCFPETLSKAMSGRACSST